MILHRQSNALSSKNQFVMKQLMHPCVFADNKAAEITVHSGAGAVASLEKVIHDKVVNLYKKNKGAKATHYVVAYLLWI